MARARLVSSNPGGWPEYRVDWLRAGQALHRLLVHAASKWVFASLYSQPLEAAAIRASAPAWCLTPWGHHRQRAGRRDRHHLRGPGGW